MNEIKIVSNNLRQQARKFLDAAECLNKHADELDKILDLNVFNRSEYIYKRRKDRTYELIELFNQYGAMNRKEIQEKAKMPYGTIGFYLSTRKNIFKIDKITRKWSLVEK